MSAQIGMAIAPEGSFLQKLGPFPTICLDLRDTNIFKILKLKTRANICVHVSYITYTYEYNPIFKFQQKDFFQTWEKYVPKLFWQDSLIIEHKMNGTIVLDFDFSL